jgi:hypothetical protein
LIRTLVSFLVCVAGAGRESAAATISGQSTVFKLPKAQTDKAGEDSCPFLAPQRAFLCQVDADFSILVVVHDRNKVLAALNEWNECPNPLEEEKKKRFVYRKL